MMAKDSDDNREEEEQDLSLDDGKKPRKAYTISKQREHWSEEEHNKFLEALKLYDRDWKKIEKFIGTKTVIQIRSHAQKWFLKVQKNNTGERIPPARPKRKASDKEEKFQEKTSRLSQEDEEFENSKPIKMMDNQFLNQIPQSIPQSMLAQSQHQRLVPHNSHPISYNHYPTPNSNRDLQRESPGGFHQWMSQNNLIPNVFAHNFDSPEALDLHNQQQEQYQQAQLHIQQVMPHYHSSPPSNNSNHIHVIPSSKSSQFNVISFLGNVYENIPSYPQPQIVDRDTVQQLMHHYQPEMTPTHFKEQYSSLLSEQNRRRQSLVSPPLPSTDSHELRHPSNPKSNYYSNSHPRE